MSRTSFGLHVQQPDVDAAGLAAQPRAAPNRHQRAVVVDADAPAEEQIDVAGLADREQPAFSRKNGRFSGKTQVEARQVDLLLVHLDLREVGVVGEIEVQARRDAELGVDAESPSIVAVSVAVGSSGSPSRSRTGMNLKLRGVGQVQPRAARPPTTTG